MKDARIRTCIDTQFEVSGLKGSGTIRNVSQTGAFIGTAAIPEGGDNIDFEFRTPDGQELRVSGVVWWTTLEGDGGKRSQGFGLRLLEENAAYDRFLTELAR